MMGYRSVVAKAGVVAAMAAIFAMANPTPAYALFKMTLSDGSSTVTIIDQNLPPGTALDANGAAGAITFIGAVGSNFLVNVTTGLSKPILGNSATAEMDLNSVNVAATGAGQLTIQITDTDFNQGVGKPGSLSWLFGGTAVGTGATATGQGWKDPSNTEFGHAGTTTGLLGPFIGAFSSAGSVAHGALANPYSMTIQIVLNFTAAGQSYSGDFNLKNVPEPASMMLLGIGLMGSGVLASRRRRRTIAE